jgi:sulfite reductase (NADPH) flavoprotein alpha-component
LEYESVDSPLSIAESRYGTASNFLRRITDDGASLDKRVSLKIVPAPNFRLPRDPQTPIVMFAGGSGIAPFIGFLEERIRHGATGQNWLFFGTRTPEHLYHAETLAQWVFDGKLELRVAFSRADVALRLRGWATLPD